MHLLQAIIHFPETGIADITNPDSVSCIFIRIGRTNTFES